MLCCCCYLCKVNIGILLPEPTLVPLGGGKGWTGYSVQDASNCPASEGTSLQEAKLSLQVAFLLELSGVMPLNPLLDSAFLLLNAHGLRTYPSTAFQFTAQQEAQLETETSQHFHTLQLETSWHPEAWFMFSFSNTIPQYCASDPSSNAQLAAECWDGIASLGMTCLSLYSGTVGEFVMKCMVHALKTVTLESELI